MLYLQNMSKIKDVKKITWSFFMTSLLVLGYSMHVLFNVVIYNVIFKNVQIVGIGRRKGTILFQNSNWNNYNQCYFFPLNFVM